jgi:hypothetical protein
MIAIFLVSHANDFVGDVWWLDETDAMSQGLAYINGANNAIIKVDNTSNVVMNDKRNSVRLFGIRVNKSVLTAGTGSYHLPRRL